MSYAKLYEHVQTLGLHVPRNEIKSKVLALAGVNRVSIMITGMDISECRGLYFSPRNQSSALFGKFGGHVIVTARGLNRCWTRLIIFKELMHLLDGNDEAIDNGDKFDSVLIELCTVSQGALAVGSPQLLSEHKAAWMALGLFCPEHERQRLKTERERGHITDYGIALQLRIPALYVPMLFGVAYDNQIQSFLNENNA